MALLFCLGDRCIRGLEWPAVKGDKHPCLTLDSEPAVHELSEDQLDRMELWKRVIEKSRRKRYALKY